MQSPTGVLVALAKTNADTLQPGSGDDADNREPWLAFLPFVSEEMVGPIFRSFVRRAAMVMSSINFTAPCLPPLPDDMSLILESAPFKLITASKALLKLYNNGSDYRKSSLLEIVKEDQVFVYSAVKLTCKVLQLYGNPLTPFWQGPATGFLGLIVWSLDSSNIFRKQIEELGLLTTIISHLRLLPLEAVQDMSENKTITQTVWLLLRILFQCTARSDTVQVHVYYSSSQALLPLLKAPDVELRLISKALYACWSLTAEDSLILGDAEVSRVIQMLNTDLTEPFSFHGLSFEALFTMIKNLAKVPQNALLFAEKAIPSILADLSERVLGDEQEAAMELLWLLMQGDGDAITRDTTDPSDCIKPGSEAEQSHQLHTDELSQGLERSSQDEAAVEFTEVLLRYLIRTLLPYENLPLDDGFSQLPESTWFSISVSIMLVALLLRESNEQLQTEIVQSVVALRGACRAIQLAIEIGFTIEDEGLPKSVMLSVMRDLLKVSMAWTDQSHVLAQEMSQSGFVHMLTTYLHAGNYVNTFNQNVTTVVLLSLFNLLNCAYYPSNHPAFRFSETIPELIPFIESTNFDVASTAKFTLSCLHQQLDCDQLLALKLTDKEAEYCVTTLARAIDSPSFKANGFAVHELLKILTNLTHSYSAMKKFVEVQSAGGRKQKRPEEHTCSSFDQQMLKTADELEKNSQKLMSHGLSSVIERVFRVEKFQEAAAKLLLNLVHHQPVVESDFSAMIEILKSLCESPFHVDHQLAAQCCLWQLRAVERDHKSSAKYAQGCYKLECYFETVLVCSEIAENISDDQDALKHEVKLLKGKAMFYAYQRKMWYLMENRSSMPKAEEKRLIDECFHSMMETINLLGTALDNLYLDDEGSQLLDWAMMDCIRETNKLNQCERCLLCRQYGRSLCKSHIFPKFILKNAPLSQTDETEGGNKDPSKKISEVQTSSRKEINIKPFLFGLDKHQMKSAGECWLWMCCKKCEGIMTQNAENYFSRLFPTIGEIEYSSWLFSYCCTIIFRTLSCVKFPRTFNDEEVYNAFLFCRMHLLSLPIKFGRQDSTTTDVEKYQLRQLSQTASKELKPFLLITPSNIMFKSESISQASAGMLTIPWLAPHRLVDGRKDLAGKSHFFVAYCSGISILLKFLPSSKYNLPDSCCISPHSGTYTIPKEGEVTDKIPPGLWVLHHRSAIKGFQDITEALRQLGTHTAEKMASTTKFSQSLDEQIAPEKQPSAPELKELSSGITNSLFVGEAIADTNKEPTTTQTSAKDSSLPKPQLYHSNKPQLSLLPPDFKVIQPLPNTQMDKYIKLPHGHQIVLHRVEEAHQLSCLLAVGSSDSFPPDQPYVIFVDNRSKTAYIDGAFITTVDKEIRLTQFLLDHAMYSEMRDQLKMIHQRVEVLLTALLQSSFMNLDLFVHYLKCRQSIRGSDDLPSLGTKCSPEGCWYCKDLCHCCLKPAHSWSKGETLQDIPYRFCSKKCMGLFCFHPSKMSQSTFVIDHRDEFKTGKFKGPSVLDVLYISRSEGEVYNTVEFINFCVGDGSKGLPLKEPYVLWQVRNIDSQVFMNFHTTEECIPLGPLWPSLLGEEGNVVALQEAFLKLEPKLSSIIRTALKALGCKDIQVYLSVFTPMEAQ